MLCEMCGTEMPDGVTVCAKCDAQDSPQVDVPNHLVLAILVTLFCCQIFGIVAIVYAAQVNAKLAAGDVQGAIECSNKASKWIAWGIVIPIAIYVIGIFASLIADLATH